MSQVGFAGDTVAIFGRRDCGGLHLAWLGGSLADALGIDLGSYYRLDQYCAVFRR